MKQRIKRLLLIGFTFTIISCAFALILSLFRDDIVSVREISDLLFSEALIIIVLACFLLVSGEFTNKKSFRKDQKDDAQASKEDDKSTNNILRLNKGLELIIIAAPILLISILITWL